MISVLRMNMTTLTGQSEGALSSTSQPYCRYHRTRASSSSMDMLGPNCAKKQVVTQTQMQLKCRGYTRGDTHQLQGKINQGQPRATCSCRPQTKGQPQARVLRAATNAMIRELPACSVRHEDLAGRPAMITLHQDDLPLDARQERSGNSSSFYGTLSGSNSRNRVAKHATVSHSRQRAGTGLGATDEPSSRPASGCTLGPGRTSIIAATSSSEVTAWRVAFDPKSKKPYYFHAVTRETTWKKPAELMAAETREKRQFFTVMEHNIRVKLRDGYYTRRSETLGSNYSTPDAGPKRPELSPHCSTRSSASTVSCNSVRSSLNSVTSGSARSLSGSARQNIFSSTHSLPTTPERTGVLLCMQRSETQLQQPQHEPESESTETRPSLFRTLSSYETPIVSLSRKASDGMENAAMACAIPSPIQERLQERLRLAALVPPTSMLAAHARAASGKGRPSLSALAPRRSHSALGNANLGGTNEIRAQPRRLRRANSTNSIYLRLGTMNAPDQDATIQCVATVLRAHMIEALDDPIRSEPRFDVFVTARDRQRVPFSTKAWHAKASRGIDRHDHDDNHDDGDDMNVMVDVVPTWLEMATFITTVLSRAQMESECIILSLVYVERLLKATSGCFQLRGENWRRLVFCSLVLTSKVWDDLSMSNADFANLWPELSLKDINDLELVYLSAVEYNVRVSAVSYAKYYFHLRTLCATMGLVAARDELAPLNLEMARKLQVLSEEYHERARIMPVPRRRSVTITSASSSDRLLASGHDGHRRHDVTRANTSPTASLEQLVHMQVRVAGGSSATSSWHRESMKRAVKQ